MGLQKGQTNNPFGRPKGIPNKTTTELRQIFQSFVEANLDRLQADFNQLEAKDRLAFVLQVARLVLPPPMHELDKMTDQQFSEYLTALRENKKSLLPVSN